MNLVTSFSTSYRMWLNSTFAPTTPGGSAMYADCLTTVFPTQNLSSLIIAVIQAAYIAHYYYSHSHTTFNNTPIREAAVQCFGKEISKYNRPWTASKDNS